jgi:uncharacterized membrane protein (DUF441 family)
MSVGKKTYVDELLTFVRQNTINLGVVILTCNPSTQEAKEEELQI